MNSHVHQDNDCDEQSAVLSRLHSQKGPFLSGSAVATQQQHCPNASVQ